MQKLLGQCVASLMSRQRSMEACLYTCVVIPSSVSCIDAMKKLGATHEAAIKKAKEMNKKFKTKLPMHIGMFLTSVQAMVKDIKNEQSKTQLQQFLDNARMNTTQLSRELKYWRRLDTFKPEYSKLLWHAVPGTDTDKALRQLVLPYLVASTTGGEEKDGIAPRSSKERQLIKMVYNNHKAAARS